MFHCPKKQVIISNLASPAKRLDFIKQPIKLNRFSERYFERDLDIPIAFGERFLKNSFGKPHKFQRTKPIMNLLKFKND